MLDLTAYRIVQEALTNTVKHAEGARAWVTVKHDGNRLVIEVINELSGAAANREGARGAGHRSTQHAGASSRRRGLIAGWQVHLRLAGTGELPVVESPEGKVRA